MRTQKKGRIAFAVCGSFCTLDAALAAAETLTRQGWELLPIMSFAAGQDTRFGTGKHWKDRLEALTGHAVRDTLQAVEPLGPQRLAGKERGQHPAAGHRPAGGAEYAGAAVPMHGRHPLRRSSEPCHRGLGTDLYRPCTGQLRGGMSGGK